MGRGRRPLCECVSSDSAWCGGRGIDECRCEREPQYPLQFRSLPRGGVRDVDGR